jgi:hypothetical protein
VNDRAGITLIEVIVSGYVNAIHVESHLADEWIAVNIDSSSSGGVKKFERVEHCSGGHIPVARTFFAPSVVRIGIDELIQANHDFLDALVATILISIQKECHCQPVPAYPCVPIIHWLDLTIWNLDPGKVVSRFASRQSHPHEVLGEKRIQDTSFRFEIDSLAYLRGDRIES